MNKILIVAALFMSIQSVAISGTAKNDHRDTLKCNFLKSENLDLTGDGKLERLSASVYGKNCAVAKFTVTIETNEKKRMYSFSEQFKYMYVAHRYNKEEVDHEARRLLNMVFSYNRKVMPEINKLVHKSELQGIQEFYSVTKDKYLKLKSQNLPYISHPVHYEGGLFVTFDKQKNKIVKFGGY